jgi:hypothetical protein
MTFNPLFLLATATFGWGFSLAIYRFVAHRFGWPMGMMQARHPLAVILLGVAALVLSFLFIMSDPSQRWPVLLLGLIFALFWTGFLRVASQSSLFLAPVAGLLLGVVWASTDDGMREIRAIDDKVIERTMKIEKGIEDRVRAAMQKAQGLRQPTLEELEKSTPVPPIPLPSQPPAVQPGTPPKKTTQP